MSSSRLARSACSAGSIAMRPSLVACHQPLSSRVIDVPALHLDDGKAAPGQPDDQVGLVVVLMRLEPSVCRQERIVRELVAQFVPDQLLRGVPKARHRWEQAWRHPCFLLVGRRNCTALTYQTGLRHWIEAAGFTAHRIGRRRRTGRAPRGAPLHAAADRRAPHPGAARVPVFLLTTTRSCGGTNSAPLRRSA